MPTPTPLDIFIAIMLAIAFIILIVTIVFTNADLRKKELKEMEELRRKR